MTDQEINVAIAEFEGWERRASGKWSKNGDLLHVISDVPNYCADLNAIHEAEKKLIPELLSIYASYLFDLATSLRIGNGKTFCMSGETLVRVTTLTAKQRAIALLKTIGKWRE